MNCEQVKYELIELLEGTLSAEVLDQVEDHLRKCTNCSGFQAELKLSLEVVNEEKLKSPSDLFTGKVLALIEENQQHSRNFTIGVKKVLLYAAVMAIGVFIGAFTGSMLSENSIQVSENEPQEFYLDGLNVEPLESFLISN
jgi:predicted anti-sigma-YlaC factor YlaD